ncbi:hypothetical protein [Pseudodesulfovibrio sediminis]|uniref:Uncharacterized protein n=1 Tax=Pseudodesulfovibrio sediminis TaxID=2810563 RepID=A0ABN6ET77_9BACT|nr:hypothetical protein [Pseudodesulfovibrio sediminis]BCS89547.1 hypothetical protein PSDVSF_27890 [Pseudodesulfovibrio sediminis]
MKTLFAVVMTDNMDKYQPGFMGDGLLERTPPKIKLCCVHDPLQEQLWYYEEAEVETFIQTLKQADKIYTVQGGVDVASLVYRYGMPQEIMCERNHFDLLQVINNTMGRRLSYRGIGEIHWNAIRWIYRVKGHPSDVDWKRACQVEAALAWELWNKWSCGGHDEVMEKIELALGLETGFKPTFCSKCGAWGEFEEQEWDCDDMSDGEMGDYLAGSFGSLVCKGCNHSFDYGF